MWVFLLAASDRFALPIERLEGVRLLVFVLLFVPFVFLAFERQIRGFLPDAAEDSEGTHGRDYYMGYTVGRTALKPADLDDLVRQLRRESLAFQLQEDKGGEKVFVARTLPSARAGTHELEAGLLSGGLYRATGTRFEVDEERCAARGDGYCRFVAIRG